MNVGHAYMGIAGILILFGSLMGFNGIDPYGDILLLISLPFILYGSKAMAGDEGETAEADVE